MTMKLFMLTAAAVLVSFLSNTTAQQQVCLIDVALVIDHSGSIRDSNPQGGPDNWGLVLSFVRAIVNALNIGEEESHMAAVSFGNTATLDFDFNQHKNRASMLQAVNRIAYKGGNTNTTGGLRETRLNVFSPAGGDRANVRDILILITDGVPTWESALLDAEVARIKARGIRLIAVGVTDQIDADLLKKLVSAPSDTHYFSVAEFGLLQAILGDIINEACRTLKPLPPTLPTPEACSSRFDTVFVLDSSGSIESRHFDLMKSFVANLIEGLDLESGQGRVGLMTFADDARLVFNLDRYNSRTEASDAVKAIRHTRGTTNTASALQYARQNMFTSGSGARSGVPNVLIVLTDGGSNDKRRTQDEAYAARRAGIHIIVVGLGSWTDENELSGMASHPYKDVNKIEVKEYNDLARHVDSLRALFCNNDNECVSNPCRNGGTCVDGLGAYTCRCPAGWAGVNCDIRCRTSVDVAFALDSSGSVGRVDFQRQVDFVRRVIGTLNLNSDHRVAALTYASTPTVRFHLDDYTSRYAALNGVTFFYTGGTTNTAGAISMLRSDIFKSSRGDRGNVANVGIVITDGLSNDPSATWEEAVKARLDGIDLLAIGVGNNANDLELRAIASAPGEQNVIRSSDFGGLARIEEKLFSAICKTEDACSSQPCQGDARCLWLMNGYRCECQNGRSGRNCERRCSGKLDIVFILDSSGSIRRQRFSKIIDLVTDIVAQFAVSSSGTRFGAVSFSDSATLEFNLKDYTSQQDVIMRLRRIRFNGGRTHTSSALRIAKDEMFTAGNGDRQDAQNIVIVVTDGNSNINEDRTIPDAIDARLRGIHTVVIAIGEQLNQLELRGIASQPPDQTLFNARSWRDLPGQLNSLVSATCDDENECSSSPCRNGGQCTNALKRFWCECSNDFSGETCLRSCARSMDVAFVLDISGSVDLVYDVSLRFIRRVIYGLPMRFDRAHVALVSFADNAQVHFKLNTYEGLQEVLNALSFRQAGGKTNTQEALRLMYNEVFSGSGGDRLGVDNIAIVVTDGKSNIQPSRTIPEAEVARQRGIRLYTAALTDQADMAEANGISNDPDSEHVVRLRDAGDVERAADQLLDRLCQ